MIKKRSPNSGAQPKLPNFPVIPACRPAGRQVSGKFLYDPLSGFALMRFVIQSTRTKRIIEASFPRHAEEQDKRPTPHCPTGTL
jgi:hypothetical protein